MNRNDKISIALCTYSGEKFLRPQLESFVNQTRLPGELIVCDDNSHDATVKILEKFALDAPFAVRIYKNEENLGTIKNFEKAISLCEGDLIFLSDQDDVWEPQKIEVFCEEFAAHPAASLIFSNAALVDEKLSPLGINLWDFTFSAEKRQEVRTVGFFEKLLEINLLTGATMAFRSTLREIALPIPTDLPLTIHDGWIALIAAANGELRFLNENLIKYRQHSNQQVGVYIKTASDSLTDFENSINLHRQNIARLEKLGKMIETTTAFLSKKSSATLIPALIEKENAIIHHYKMRIEIIKGGIKNFPTALGEIFSGRYHRFSNGFGSAVKDCLQK